ncbi:MAG: hypothetical protein IKD97_02165 [Firmicutes bacterium]|nr:hypothetical protein [Bacillota bacterium]
MISLWQESPVAQNTGCAVLMEEVARYEMSCDNMSMFGTGTMGMEMMPPGQVIFNKDNDNYKSEELAELMKRFAEEEEII